MPSQINRAVQVFRDWVSASDNIVFFGGAGVSTESGIPDFRSTDGLYCQHYQFPPETILSHSFYTQQTEEFYQFYREKMLCLTATPNAAHRKLAWWEKNKKLRAVITQNIDGLHQAAGSKKVFELHGSIHRNYCQRCGALHDASYVLQSAGIPQCKLCGGELKPDVVLYGEALNADMINGSIDYITNADILIVGGTSLAVYPAAGLINCYRGKKLVLINKTPTSADSRANLVIHGAIGEIFSLL